MRTKQILQWTFAVALLSGMPRGVTAQNDFTPATGTYQTDANWSLGHVPTGAEQMRISGATLRSAMYSSATNYTTTGRFLIGFGGLGELITDSGAGTLTFGGDNFSNANYVGVGTNGQGALTMNGGTITLTGAAGLNVAGNNSGATGTVTINSGATINVGNRLLIAANNTTTNGTVTLNGGTLNLGTGSGAEAGVYRAGSGTSALNLDAGTLSLNYFYSDHGPGGGADINFNGATVKALMTTAGFTTGNFTANIKNGGAIIDTNSFDIAVATPLLNDGTGGLTKQNNGMLTLSNNANTYIGNTVVSGGTLKLTTNTTNNIANSAQINLANGTTLDVTSVTGSGGFALAAAVNQVLSGTGTVSGNLTVPAGTFINPGTSPGILTVNGNLSIAGTFTADLAGSSAGSGYDQILLNSGTGNVTLSGTLADNFSGSSWSSLGDTLWILRNDTAGTLTGAFSNYATNGQSIGNYDGKTWQIWYGADFATNSLTGGNDVALFAIPVPEPSSLAMLAFGMISLWLFRRKR